MRKIAQTTMKFENVKEGGGGKIGEREREAATPLSSVGRRQVVGKDVFQTSTMSSVLYLILALLFTNGVVKGRHPFDTDGDGVVTQEERQKFGEEKETEVNIKHRAHSHLLQLLFPSSLRQEKNIQQRIYDSG